MCIPHGISIHPSISYNRLSFRGSQVASQSPFMLTVTPTGNLESPINLTCFRLQDHPEETHGGSNPESSCCVATALTTAEVIGQSKKITVLFKWWRALKRKLYYSYNRIFQNWYTISKIYKKLKETVTSYYFVLRTLWSCVAMDIVHINLSHSIWSVFSKDAGVNRWRRVPDLRTCRKSK